MFDELSVKRNKDNTYVMHVKGLIGKEVKGKHELLVHKMNSFPLELERVQSQDFDRYPSFMPRSNSWYLNIRAQLLPKRGGETMQLRTKPKARRILSIR
ncbi:hypothetical protein [Paenibacillus lautus]|uniref:hypothetical protein n=1 Tax=Paenibacillus lautus TaxID=1401 RepID=UPI001C7DCC46|nr:hypothetical protein [Paenibacillus lautus]MBX4152228.1 hypothetical protein [Paenibacillus lautus]